MKTHQTRFWKAGGIATARTAGVVGANRATPPPPHRAARDRKIALAIFALVVAVCQAGTTIRAQAVAGRVPANLWRDVFFHNSRH